MNRDIDFQNKNHIHFIGIGGIGVSAIARKMLEEGKTVTGSDASESELIETLRDLGANISVGHHAENVTEDTDLIVYSVAVPHENPELARARELDIPQLTYAEALGALSRQHKTVAVAGTHGKTTTTAMLATITEADSELDLTVIVGSLLNGSQTNYVGGSGDYFIVEACEYKRSFLHLSPDILIITNIDRDHLDYFDGLDDIQDAFKEAAENVSEDGYIICNPEDDNLRAVLEEVEAEIVDYTKVDDKITLPVPGKHNISNAQAAIAASTFMEVKEKDAISALKNFKGTWRRAQKKGETEEGALVYDDYAHHPAEIKTTLEGFREKFPDKKMIVVFQPHLFSRTKKLLEEFAGSFQSTDEVIVLPIYAARETPDEAISSGDLVKKLSEERGDVRHEDSFESAEKHLDDILDKDTLLITMGAGDVYKLGEELIKREN